MDIRVTMRKVIMLFIGSLIVAIALSIITVAIPAPGFHARIGENLELLSWHSDFYPSVMWGRNFSRLDNHTDALMTQIAMDNPRISVLQQAFDPLVIRTFVDELRKIPNMVKSLRARYYDGAVPDFGYGRYWHGYRTPLRLLGSIMSYQQLRILNYICIGALFVASGVFVGRALGRSFRYLYLGSLLAVSIYLVPLSLQYLSVFYVLLVSVSVLMRGLVRRGKQAPIIEVITLSAIAVAYLDFLTAPLIVGGLLVGLYTVWLYRDRSLSGRQIGRMAGGLFLLWFGTYAAFWAVKGLVARLFGVRGVLESFTSQVGQHTLHATTTDWVHAIPFNLATFMGATSLDTNMKDLYYWLYVAGFFVLVALSVVIWRVLMQRAGPKSSLRIARRYAPLLPLSLTPFFWWQLKPWQSANHLFVHREIAIFLFSLGAFYLLTYYEARHLAREPLVIDEDSRCIAP